MNTSTIRQLKCSALALAFSALMVPVSTHSQTLEQAVAHTLESNPEILIAFNRFKAREEQVDQAFAGYLPTVDISGGYGWERTNSPATRTKIGTLNPGVIDGNSDVDLTRGEAGFSIKQMLFDGFYTSSEVNRFSYEASAEQWALFAAAEDMALEVAKVYVNYIRTEQVVGLAEKNLANHQDIYEQIKERTDSGLGSVADLSQITGRLARANANVISAVNNYYDANAQFIRVVEQQPEALIVPVPDDAMMPESLASSIQQAEQNHPILKSASNDIHAAEYERSSALSNYYPQFTLDLDGNWNNNIDGEDGTRTGNNVGGHNNDLVAMVRAKYNLFAGGRDLAREKEAAYKIGESKEIRERAYRQVVEGVSLSWNAYELLQPQKLFIREHVIAAKDTQVAYYQQFNLGQRTLLDLLDTENELFEARKDYLEAEYDEVLSQYRILNATGRLLESLRVTRPQVWQGESRYKGGVN